MSEPYKCSPLQEKASELQAVFTSHAGWRVAQRYALADEEVMPAQEGVALLDESANGKFRLEGQTACNVLQISELPIGKGLALDYGWVYRLRGDLLLVKTLPAGVDKALKQVRNQLSSVKELNTVIDITHGCSELRLLGPNSQMLLGRICGLDFHERSFPNMSVRQSSVAKTSQIVIRQDLGDLPSFSLLGPRSLAAYLWQTIMVAGGDLGVSALGRAAFERLQQEQAN